ncbi:Dimeric alpha-beta barrel [Niveomyces insectorum RCEF 264]|uniref:Dimeric alpha-beta barrel n=1 Tax=Niveomyces insectorum RCEF 264 TaxID=1081102 RepID=A0A167Y789_9HYPO|nr:Dimeric alpha-beta barrel [Niveomyces insectorum RCEF 264]
MAQPTAPGQAGLGLSGPGIFWVNSRVKDPAEFPFDDFLRWYDDVHIPDILRVKPDGEDGGGGGGDGIRASWRYRCTDPNRASPVLVVHKCPDLAFLQTAAFRSIPMTHASLPGNKPIHQLAALDTRFVQHVETWSSPVANDGRAPMLVSEAIDPAADVTPDAFDAWFRSVHVPEVAALPGWRRTSRFALAFKKPNPDTDDAAHPTPRFLALHEFAEGPAAATDTAVVPASGIITTFPPQPAAATRAILDAARTVDVAAFRYVCGFGDVDTRWVDTAEKRV